MLNLMDNKDLMTILVKAPAGTILNKVKPSGKNSRGVYLRISISQM